MNKPTSICCDAPKPENSDICPECGEHTEFLTDAEYLEKEQELWERAGIKSLIEFESIIPGKPE